MLNCNFNQNYFENGIANNVSLYENYRWIPELTFPMVHDYILELGINKNHTILDFGCAKGFTVKAFRMFGYNSFGVDISEYALNSAPNDVREYLSFPNNVPNMTFDFCISKDVFEHIPYLEIDGTIDWIMKRSNVMFAIIPLGRNGKYEIPQMDLDITHIIAEPIGWWEDKFMGLGYTLKSSSFFMSNIKNKWVEKYPTGNGFFIVEKNVNG